MKNPKALVDAIGKIEKLKLEIAQKRDALRDAISEADEIAESLDETIDALDEGKRAYERAVEEMSKYV